MTNMTVSETLNKAADLIEERGWKVGPGGWPTLGQEGDPLCLEGGLMAALGIELPTSGPDREYAIRGLQSCAAYRVVWDFLQDDDRWYTFRASLYDWNDAPGRTADQVIAALRAAAVIAASRETEPTTQPSGETVASRG